MHKTSSKSLNKKKALFIVTMVVIVLLFGMRLSRDRSECDKWLYYQNSGKTVNSLEEAIAVFREFLPSEQKYKNHTLPETLEEFVAKYNVVPYKRTQKVRTKEGKYEEITVYDMLLAYGVGEDGTIYKYKMCGMI